MSYCDLLYCGISRSCDCLCWLRNLEFQGLFIDVFEIRGFAILEITTLKRSSVCWGSMALTKSPPEALILGYWAPFGAPWDAKQPS